MYFKTGDLSTLVINILDKINYFLHFMDRYNLGHIFLNSRYHPKCMFIYLNIKLFICLSGCVNTTFHVIIYFTLECGNALLYVMMHWKITNTYLLIIYSRFNTRQRYSDSVN